MISPKWRRITSTASGEQGRAGARRAITLAIPAQRKLVRAIEKLVGDALVLGKPSKETAKVMKAIAERAGASG
ncbi:MAG: hypothetical protein R2688_07950 [Fimbriimonadaceae bacterium]